MRNVDANTVTLRAYLTETQSEFKGSFYAFDSTGFVTGVAMEQEGVLFNANEYSIVYEHKTRRLASGHGHDHASWKLGSMNPRSMSILANHTEKEEEKVVSIVIADQQSFPSEEVLRVFAGKLLTAGLSLERKAVMVFKDRDLEFTLEELQNLGKDSKW